MIEFLKLVFPVVLTYLGHMAMGFVDLLYVGRINSEAIGAVGVGTSIFSWFMVLGIGMVSGMDHLVSRSHGAKDRERQYEYLVQGFYLSAFLAIPLTFVLMGIAWNLDLLGVNAKVLPPARSYLLLLSLSLLPTYLFNLFRFYLTSIGKPRVTMMMLVLGNIMNALIGYVLILGHWGVQSLGAPGAAWATLVSRVVMMVGLVLYVYWADRKNGSALFKRKWDYHPDTMRSLVGLGVPSAFQMLFEVGVFALTTVFAARLTPNELAAHQIVFNTAGITFMVPLGVGSATAVMVGQAIGRKDRHGVSVSGLRGYTVGIGFMGLAAFVLICFPDWVLGAFTKDPGVIEFAKSILFVAGLFQLSDGAQTVGTGALRGLGDTKSAMYFNLFGHWMIGLPLGLLLCFYWGWGLKGLWTGLSVGLTLVSFGVLARWWQKSSALTF